MVQLHAARMVPFPKLGGHSSDFGELMSRSVETIWTLQIRCFILLLQCLHMLTAVSIIFVLDSTFPKTNKILLYLACYQCLC